LLNLNKFLGKNHFKIFLQVLNLLKQVLQLGLFLLKIQVQSQNKFSIQVLINLFLSFNKIQVLLIL